MGTPPVNLGFDHRTAAGAVATHPPLAVPADSGSPGPSSEETSPDVDRWEDEGGSTR
jgi:hypothetical protein